MLGALPYHIGRPVPPLQSAELLARTPQAWGLGPRPCRELCTLSDLSQINGCLRPATSPNHVIHTEHINQLSRFHAQKLSVLNFVRFDQALYFFGKKLFVENFLVKTLFVTHKFKYPIYLGASFMKPFLLHMIILVWLCSLFLYYATICTLLT